MMDSFSIDGFDGDLRLVSAADINEVFALESESRHVLFILYVCM